MSEDRTGTVLTEEGRPQNGGEEPGVGGGGREGSGGLARVSCGWVAQAAQTAIDQVSGLNNRNDLLEVLEAGVSVPAWSGPGEASLPTFGLPSVHVYVCVYEYVTECMSVCVRQRESTLLLLRGHQSPPTNKNKWGKKKRGHQSCGIRALCL